jgi:hypothetical protein
MKLDVVRAVLRWPCRCHLVPTRVAENSILRSGSNQRRIAFSLPLCTVKFSEVWLFFHPSKLACRGPRFLRKSHVGSACSVYIRSDNALMARVSRRANRFVTAMSAHCHFSAIWFREVTSIAIPHEPGSFSFVAQGQADERFLFGIYASDGTGIYASDGTGTLPKWSLVVLGV